MPYIQMSCLLHYDLRRRTRPGYIISFNTGSQIRSIYQNGVAWSEAEAQQLPILTAQTSLGKQPL